MELLKSMIKELFDIKKWNGFSLKYRYSVLAWFLGLGAVLTLAHFYQNIIMNSIFLVYTLGGAMALMFWVFDDKSVKDNKNRKRKHTIKEGN